MMNARLCVGVFEGNAEVRGIRFPFSARLIGFLIKIVNKVCRGWMKGSELQAA